MAAGFRHASLGVVREHKLRRDLERTSNACTCAPIQLSNCLSAVPRPEPAALETNLSGRWDVNVRVLQQPQPARAVLAAGRRPRQRLSWVPIIPPSRSAFRRHGAGVCSLPPAVYRTSVDFMLANCRAPAFHRTNCGRVAATLGGHLPTCEAQLRSTSEIEIVF